MSIFVILIVLVIAVVVVAAVNSRSGGTIGDTPSATDSLAYPHRVNPATGLPLTSGEAHGLDIAGNLYRSRSADNSGVAGLRRNALGETVEEFGGFDAMSSGTSGMAGGLFSETFVGPMSTGLGLDTSHGDFFGSGDVHMSYVNPATGLPMISDSTAGVDVGGSPYGMNNHDFMSSHDFMSHHESFSSHDSFSSFDASSSAGSFGGSSDWS